MLIAIERALVSDLQQIRNIGIATFIESFAEQNTEANMNDYLAHAFSEAKLTEELNAEGSAFYIARFERRIIGYLKVNWGAHQTELITNESMEIERIYVLREFHGQQVGQQIFDFALDLAKEKNVDIVWLGVWEKNPRAIRFYEKNGFVAFDKHIFKLGNDEQTDIMLRLELKTS